MIKFATWKNSIKRLKKCKQKFKKCQFVNKYTFQNTILKLALKSEIETKNFV